MEIEEEIKQYVIEAKKQGKSVEEIRNRFKEMYKRNKRVLKLVLQEVDKVLEEYLDEEMTDLNNKIKKLKGGFNKKMPKKKDDFEEDEEDEEDEDDEDEEEEDEDEFGGFDHKEPEPKVKKRVPKKPSNYVFQHTPETLRLVDPVRKVVIVEGANEASLQLQMLAKILQMLEDRL